jgi:hypothetical protein
MNNRGKFCGAIGGVILCLLYTVSFAQEDYTTWSQHQVINLNTSPSRANVAANEYNFPVLIRLTPANFSGFSLALLQGADIRFSKTDYSKHLSYQIESWVDKAGFADSAVIWVRVDTVFGSSATQSIVMHYGKTGVTSQSNGPAVFDTTNGYQAVYHFAEGTGGNANDATINNYLATAIGTPIDTIGVIGRARYFNGTTSAFYLANTAIPPSKLCFPGNGFYTVSVWVNSMGFSTNLPSIISKGPTSGSGGQYHLFERYTTASGVSSAQWSFIEQRSTAMGGQQSRRTPAGSAASQQNQWVHIVGVRNGPNMALYINGVNAGTGSDSSIGGGTRDTTENVGIGARLTTANVGGNFWTGIIDEPEISNVVRDSGWIMLSYQNQQPSQTLVTLPILVTLTAPPLLSPTNGASSVPINVNLGWGTVNGAASYRVQAATDTTFLSPVFSQSGITAISVPASGLSGSTSYHWRVSAANAGGNGPWSSIWSFTTVPGAAGIPILSTPTNAATGQPTSEKLTWGSAASASTYNVQLSTSVSFSAPTSLNGLIGTSANFTNLSINTTYYWRVDAANSLGTSNWSGIWSFTTGTSGVAHGEAPIGVKTDLAVTGSAIEYSLAASGPVEITFCDLLGRSALVINRQQSAGTYSLTFRECALVTGNYIVRLKTGGFSKQAMVLITR